MRCPLRSMTLPISGPSADSEPAAPLSFVAIGADAGRVVILAVDDEERPMPARPIREMTDDHPELPRARGGRTPLRRRLHVERPIDHERAPLDHPARHRSPETRVVRVVAVVAHREI